LRWSPDGARLAFVTDREDHSFIAVYSFGEKSILYLDPSTDLDHSPEWSPDSKRLAFLRVPGDKNALLIVPHRTALPWSIRIADAATGKSTEAWKGAPGQGSAYREMDSEDQLHWAAGDHIVFPWERDGWLHFYSVSTSGGIAKLLTPGTFEVEHVSMSGDGKTLVFDSNQNDIIWRLALDGASAPEALSSGGGIETQPVVLSDSGIVAALRSDVHAPMHAAIVEHGKLTNLAPQAISADFPGAQFVTPQQIIFSAGDGLPIHGQLFVPRDVRPGEKRPARCFSMAEASGRCCSAGITWSTTPTPTR
jgi:Tol biopolymer transport system component